MRLLPIALLAIAACGGGQIQNLPLEWRGVDQAPKASAAVAEALTAVPIAFALRDARPDPTMVGQYDDGFVVRTSDNVAQYCAGQLGDLLRRAGARLDEAPGAIIEADLLEYRVDEGGTFKGLVRVRVAVHRGGNPDWSKAYDGTSNRWGRTHNPENFNEALSNALTEVAEKLLHDDELARALMPAGPPPPPALPPAP